MRRTFISMTDKGASGWTTVERRRARRFRLDWDVVVRGKDESGLNFFEPGGLRDLSSRGAFLSISKHLRVGTRLEVWIRMPSDPERWMGYAAEIVRIDLRNGGLGSKFLNARPKLHSKPQPGFEV